MSLKLVAKKTLSQRIALTPSLKKSIDLLQLSKFELLERISDACHGKHQKSFQVVQILIVAKDQ